MKKKKKKEKSSVRVFYDRRSTDVIHLSQPLYPVLKTSHRFLIHQPLRVYFCCLEALGCVALLSLLDASNKTDQRWFCDSVNWSVLKFLAKQSRDYFSPGSIPRCSSLCRSTHGTIEGVVWEENDLYRAAGKQEIIKSVFCGTRLVTSAIKIWNPPCDNPFYFDGVLKWVAAKLIMPQRVQMTHVLQSLQSL